MSYPPNPNDATTRPTYLRNIHEALFLDANNNVCIRTGIAGDVIIEGPVTIPGTVNVSSSVSDPVHTHVSEVGTSGVLTIPNMPVSIQDSSGNENSNTYPVYVSGTVATIQSGTWNVGVTGNVNATQSGTWNVGVSGNVNAVQTGTWTVNVGTMPEVEIKNDVGNPIPVTGNLNATITGTPTVTFDGTNTDAFGRLRVSNPLTLFDTQNKYTDQGQFVSSLAGGGTAVYNQPSNTFLLSVTGAGSSVVRETTNTFIYQPGKSLLIMNTFCMNTPTAGLTQRVGYYNANNGVFFEVDGTTINMVIRSSSSGSIVEDRVSRNLWNGDKLNGSGPSGITLYPDRTQIFWTDIEWLGVGSVRCGFVIGGQFIVCHTFNHANEPGNTTTYMGTAVLPVRYEISSAGPAGAMSQICSTVISEGGYSMTGTPNGIGHDLASGIVLPNDVSFKPLLSIRLKSTQPDAVVLPMDYTIVPVDQAVIKYRVYRQAVTSGGTWVDMPGNSSVQYNLSPTSIVSGSVTATGFLISNNQSINTPQDARFDFTEQLSRNPFTPTMYEYVLEAATTGTNIDVYASINWQEIT